MKQVQKRWSEDEKTILVKNYGKISYQQIETLLPGRTWFQIRNQANYLGLTGNSNLGRKYSANTHFFSVPSVLNCYWAGFIAADGCIQNKKLSIGLSVLDENHVHKFIEDVAYTGNPYYKGSTVTVTISCKQIVDDLLRNFNITERKSLTLKPPNINDEVLIASYIAGLIDGDGSISSKRENNVCITLYGTSFILEWVKTYFDKWTTKTNYKNSEVRLVKDSRHLSYYHICSSRAVQISQRLLSLDIPRLSRKWDKFSSL